MKPLQKIAMTPLLVLVGFLSAREAHARERWTPEAAQVWYKKQPWLVGCNFIPSTAINQLEMWQADTFDPKTIDRELGFAQDLGFTSVRVFLHHLLWEQDKDGFLKRMDEFLAIAERHKIGVMFVLFDSCWDPKPRLGKQREPKPGVHNSGWVQCPGSDDLLNEKRHKLLEEYTRGVIGHFKNDPRVQVWDLWNEPENDNGNSYGPGNLKQEPADKGRKTLNLLAKAFIWARAAEPTQPITSGVWIGHWADATKFSPMERLQVDQSDVISFHCYDRINGMKECVQNLKRFERPILCTEFMARPQGSTFEPILGYLKEERVAGYCWGFVAGKTNTIFAWDTWQKPATKEPDVWFHDIFRPDGKPFSVKEVDYIRKVTGKAK